MENVICKHPMPHSAHNGPIALNFFKEMVLGLLLNFSILLEELLTSMVYTGVEVTICSGIYGDGVKASATVGV